MLLSELSLFKPDLAIYTGDMNEPSNYDNSEIKNLKIEIEKLNHLLYKRTSARHLFFYAIIQGIGSIVGATIVAGILLALISRILLSVDYVPILNQYIDSQSIQDTIIPEN